MRNFSQGFSIVEFIVAIAIITSLVTVATSAWQLFFRVSYKNSHLTQATFLSEEAVEALNFLRDSSWDANIGSRTIGVPYYLSWNGSQYSISSASSTFNGAYVTKLNFAQISREAGTGNITQVGGSDDPKSRLVTVSIVNATSSELYLESPILLHDIFDN